MNESALENAKKGVKKSIAQTVRSRVHILLRIKLFGKYCCPLVLFVLCFVCLSLKTCCFHLNVADLPEAALESVAQRMDQFTYPKDTIIIQQDDLGDSFFAIENGEVVVTRKVNARDQDEEPIFITKFGPNSTFGEMSLVTDELRSATVTVCSESASVLQLTRQIFEELMEADKKITNEVQEKMTYNVIHHSCSLFTALPALSKRLLKDKLTQSTFPPGAFICRQGKPGIRFYIIISGTCEVVIDDDDSADILCDSPQKKGPAKIKNGLVEISSHERNVNILHPGDFFGEIALFSAAQLCTANVIALEPVVCMGLNRVDFQLIFSNMQNTISDMHSAYQNTAVKVHGTVVAGSGNKPTNFRRITGLASACAVGQDGYVDTLLKRMAKYMSECYWNSMYSRMYRDLLLRSSAEAECGPYATEILEKCSNRLEAIKEIRMHLMRIMEVEAGERLPADLMFLEELIGWRRCKFMSVFCDKWRTDQLMDLCRFVTFRTVRATGNVSFVSFVFGFVHCTGAGFSSHSLVVLYCTVLCVDIQVQHQRNRCIHHFTWWCESVHRAVRPW